MQLLHFREYEHDGIRYQTEGSYILGVFDKEPCYEVFGQDAGTVEELLVERVVDGRHVGQSLLLVVAQEGRRTTQTVQTGQRLTIRLEVYCSAKRDNEDKTVKYMFTEII